ncbi:hypothetical protein [Halosimplex sp. TS25]|uniref:hypothetical protein n=1 Tax=Halosimplex rarum TaxID=3396619 RepID=UPI0039E99906
MAIDTAGAAGNESVGETPRALKAQAVEDTDELDAPKRRHESARDRAHDRFNKSRQHYRGPIRASSSKLFNHDAIGVQALTAFAGTEAEADATALADQVLRIDNESAYQELVDARRLLNESRDDIDNTGIVRSMEAHLRNAERTYDRAERTMDRARDADGRRAIRLRASSIRQLRQSWRQAHFVVERAVERTNATMPVGSVDSGGGNETDGPGERNESAPVFNGSVDVSVLTDSDPVREGNGTINRTIVVNISADGPVALDSARVFVDGNQRVERNLSRLVVTANRSLPVGLRAPLAEGGHHVTVTALGNDGKTTANATLRLDGDGLNESMEARLGTDPLDPDSDSAETGSEESGNGVIDGREDFDGDGLGTLYELERGTNPLAADTDDDGLADREEFITDTDPLVADTDDDGVVDGAEDPDGDGLTNAAEFERGTQPTVADTDRDGIDDAAELANGTDPLSPDTDDDGLLDSNEPTAPFDTDPVDPDTDGDGVLDGNETYTTTTGNESLGATVDITGEGNVAAHTTVEAPIHVRYQDEYTPNASVAPFVEFESRANFSRANITIAYDESRVGSSEGNLSIYRFNESAQRYEHVDSTVDPDSNTVTATTEHFSTYTVFDDQEWLEYLQHRNDILSLRPDGSTSERIANWTFESMPSSIGASNWTCYVEPRDDGYKDQPADGGCEIESDQDAIRVWEKTNRERFLNRTTTLPEEGPLFVKVKVTAHIQSSWSHAAAVLSIDSGDGETDIYRLESDSDTSSKTRTVVRRVNVTEHAGETVTVSLRADARHTSGDNSWMRAHFIDFEQATEGVVTRDSDGDGIPDFREVKGIPLANGPNITLDPFDADTDGDGLEDGEEVNLDARLTQEPPNSRALETGYRWSSNPAAGNVDTDNDGLTDQVENGTWTIATVNRSGSAYRWAATSTNQNGSLTVSSDPSTPDTDGDGLNDAQEKRKTHTDPQATVTYGLTERHRELLESFFSNSAGDAAEARTLGLLAPSEGKDDLSQRIESLDDGSDDFDFVTVDGESQLSHIAFIALDGTERTDTWLSNRQEVRDSVPPNPRGPDPSGPRYAHYETDPWDPDTDDDGLTDGQELKGTTVVESYGQPGRPSAVERLKIIERDETVPRFGLDPTTPDSDGDGYWDGWIGVYNVSYDYGRGIPYAENHVLYREYLQSGNGIQGDEILQEQIKIHDITEAPSAGGADVDDDGVDEHSNVHVGELQWKTDPTTDTEVPDPSLEIEVDYLSGKDPRQITNNQGESVLELTRENYRLYGVKLQFSTSDELSKSTLRTVCRSPSDVACKYDPTTGDITPDSFNANELSRIESEFHNDSSTLHLQFMNEYNDPLTEIPKFAPHDTFVTSGTPGVAGHTGSPAMITAIERNPAFGVPYGAVIFVNSTSGADDAYAVLMEEVGHTLGTGYADDKVGAIAECYSGGDCYGIGIGGGTDQTPERVRFGQTTSDEWSVMATGPRSIDGFYAFSIEEISTIDTDDIPTRD